MVVLYAELISIKIWPSPISFEDMKRRSKILSDIKFGIIEEENKLLKDAELNALVVGKGSKGGFIAKTDSYIPVIVDDVNLGSFVSVKITGATATYLKSELT